jgi:hypothetical protein
LIEDEDTKTKLGALSDIANIAKKQSRRDIVHDALIVAEEIEKGYIQTNIQKFSDALYSFLDDLDQAEANLYRYHTYHDLERNAWSLLHIEGLLKEEIADLARECFYIIRIRKYDEITRREEDDFLREFAERLREMERRVYSSPQLLEPAPAKCTIFFPKPSVPAPAQYPEIEAHAVARLKSVPENNQLLIGETSILEAGILKERPQVPGFETTPVNLPDQNEVPIDITVYVEGMTINPNWIQRFTFYKKKESDKESDLVEFQLLPQTTGKKQIRVEFYYERHWLAKITFDVEVVEAERGVVSTSSSSLETTNIRPPVHQNYPVDMHIRIYPQGSRYGAEISVPGQVQRIPIAMSSHDLVVLNQHLQERILAIASGKLVRHQPGLLERAKTFFRKPVQPATFCSTNPEAKLRLLAETGYYAFKKVFSDPNVRVFMKSILTLGTRISIQITTEDFFLPWELLYPVSLDEPLSYQHFWGMNYVISRIIVRDFQPGCFVPPNIPIDTIPRLGLLTYTKLPGVSTGEIPFFDRLHSDNKLHLFKLRSLDPNKKQTEFKEFQAFWSHELNLAHFACHAVYEDGAPDMSHLMLSDEFPITLMDMEVYGVVTSNHPLIVMNACETGNLNPLYTSHFAAAFLKYGARGVVATECAVPDDFAARFAEQLYTRLLAGKPLGESLLATRRYFWKKHNDPSGLLYSMYAAPNIRLVRG